METVIVIDFIIASNLLPIMMITVPLLGNLGSKKKLRKSVVSKRLNMPGHSKINK